MEYQKIINLLDIHHWVEINNESREAYNTNGLIKFKTTMLKSTLCDYNDTYMHTC